MTASRRGCEVAVMLLGFFAAACGGRAEPTHATVEVKRGDVVFESSFHGEVEARVSHPIVAPELRNTWQVTVESVLADGTPVKKGDVVLTLAKSTMEEDLREKELELAVAQAGHRKVVEQNQDERITRTLGVRRDEMGVELAKLAVVEGVNFISKLELEKAKVELARAQLQLDMDRKELATFEKKAAAALEVERLKVTAAAEKVSEIQSQLRALEVRAPADGVLYAPYTRLMWVMGKVAPGRVVRPGDKLLELPELDRFNAVIYVRQREAALLRIGDEAAVVPTMFPDKSFKGRVVRKDEFATTRNERMGTTTPQGTLKEVRVVLELEGGEGELRPGGSVRVDLATVLARGVLVAPLAAIRESKGERWVVEADGRRTSVKIGKTSTTHAEILGGVEEGEALRL